MKIAIIVYSNDVETIWNIFRLANTALAANDFVDIFLLAKGVECGTQESLKFNVKEQIALFRERGGKLIGCGICFDHRQESMPLLIEESQCERGSMDQLYELTKTADRVLTF